MFIFNKRCFGQKTTIYDSRRKTPRLRGADQWVPMGVSDVVAAAVGLNFGKKNK
jgi:hypothetical protein